MSMSHTKEPWPEPIIVSESQVITCIPGIADFGTIAHAKRARELWNATLQMSDPAKEIQSMRGLVEQLTRMECQDKGGRFDCTCFTDRKPDDYCAPCLARHILKGNQ